MEKESEIISEEIAEKTTENNNKRKIVLSIVLALAMVFCFVGGYFSRYLFDKRSATVTSEIVNIIENNGYIIDPETGERIEFTEKDFANAIVRSLLDKYSAYYTKEEYQRVTSESQGKYDGVGIGFYDSDLIIDKVIGNSPADLQGVKEYDKIVAGQHPNAERQEFKNAVDVLYFFNDCLEDETFTIFVERNGVDGEIDFSIKTKIYLASYVSYYDSENAYLFRTDEDGKLQPKVFVGRGDSTLDKQTAHVRFSAFEGDAIEQLASVLSYMEERGRTKLIFDLRNNGGGSMDVLNGVASYLIYNEGHRKTIVAYAKSQDGYEEFSTTRNNYASFLTAISVIANENTASASECLIGAMLHYGDCFSLERLVIEKNSSGEASTFGKGIMQTTYRLVSGGAFKLTTAVMLWPDKTTSIHGKGIFPIEKNGVDNQNALKRAMETLS